MARERILITVKTYPTLSRKHGETVCTAGIRADGSWVRLYPVPFRRLGEDEQYSKFDWVELDIRKGTSDPRPETHHPTDPKEIRAVEKIGTKDGWKDRRKALKAVKVHHRLLSYRFEDVDGKRSELQVLDWEVGQLFQNCLRDAKGDEAVALAKVKQKYLDAFLKTDLHFFLGTMQQFHGYSPKPWVIIGVLPMPYPPPEEQMEFFD